LIVTNQGDKGILREKSTILVMVIFHYVFKMALIEGQLVCLKMKNNHILLKTFTMDDQLGS